MKKGGIMPGKSPVGVNKSTNQTVSAPDSGGGKMSPTGRAGKAGKKRAFSKLAIKSAIKGGHY